MANPGYHHYAVTIGGGNAQLYFDGTLITSGPTVAGYTNTLNFRIGEDPHDGGGATEEQFIGNVDEVLMINRALSGADIANLASGMSVSSVVTPLAGERAVYYDFEGATGMATDKFILDGSQDGIFHRTAAIDDASANAKLGSGSSSFTDPRIPTADRFSQIKVGPVGELGGSFTLSAVVNVPSGGYNGNNLARLFSTFQGSGSALGKLIFDADPNATLTIAGKKAGMRLVLPDGSVVVSEATFSIVQNHTLTAVYDYGYVKLYLDGVEVASGVANTHGSVNLGAFDLFVGEDLGGTQGENFRGNMDDALILGRALTPAEVASLHTLGAAALLPTLPPLPELPGDYNGDDSVDAADYVLWRKNPGGMFTPADYYRWRANFGNTASQVGSAIPEPTSAVMSLLIGMAVTVVRARRR
jgi:hypothetical protein